MRPPTSPARIIWASGAIVPMIDPSSTMMYPDRRPMSTSVPNNKRFTDRIERRETNRVRLAGLQNEKIGQCHSDLICEFSQRHAPFVE